jgi:hypothetical protein
MADEDRSAQPQAQPYEISVVARAARQQSKSVAPELGQEPEPATVWMGFSNPWRRRARM